MRIINDFPPNIDDIKTFFTLPSNTCFTYGDTLYVPDGGYVDDALMAHEETHMRQQEVFGVEKWWKFYLLSADFRLSQEVEAYQNQYREKKKRVKDRNKLNLYLVRLAKDLSSQMYGNIITQTEAMQAIKSSKLITFALPELV